MMVMKMQVKKVMNAQKFPVMYRQKSVWEMFKFEAKQLCLNTALHGYKFIILPKRTLLERVIWIIVVLVSLIAALVLLFIAWFSFQRNPTVLVTDSTHYPIWFYPFPTVTVCSYNKISKRKAYDLAKNLSKRYDMSIDEMAWDFRMLTQLIHNNNQAISVRDYTRLQDLLEINNISAESALQRLAPNCDDMLLKCKWKGEEKRCESIFELVKTTEGYCCTFNYFALKNHNFSGALPNKAPRLPRKVSACGYQTALEVLMDSDTEDYFATNFASIGHQILLSNPYNFPDWTSQTMLNGMKILNLIGVTPTITYSTENVKNLEVDKRHCMFPHERELYNFRHYTFQNCMSECRMNISRRLCGCIPFYYHNPNGTFPRPKICNLRDVACLKDNRHLIFSSVPGYDFNSIGINHVYGTEKGECDCLPDCEYVDYLGESSSGQLNRDFSTNQLNLYGDIKIRNQSVFRVFFNDLVSIKNRRDVMFTWHTLLAYYGGLLGLFIGFSFVSAIEILYFFTIRLIADASNRNTVTNEPMKLKPAQKIRVQPLQFEHLDVKNLMAKNGKAQIRFRRNSNSCDQTKNATETAVAKPSIFQQFAEASLWWYEIHEMNEELESNARDEG